MEQEQEVSRLEGRKYGGVSAGRWAAINRGNQSGDIVHSESTEYIALRVWSSISWSIEKQIKVILWLYGLFKYTMGLHQQLVYCSARGIYGVI